MTEAMDQRWSPRGHPWPREHILKSLASKLQVLENCPVLGSRTALFFEALKSCSVLLLLLMGSGASGSVTVR